MRGLACGAFAAAALMGGAAAAAPSVQIKDAVARVTVIPEDRADVKVEFLTRNPSLPLTVTTIGERTVIDGDLDHNRIHSCMVLGGKITVGVRGVGKVDWNDIPQVVVRTPRESRVSAGGAVFGTIGRSESLSFANAGCGDWTIANARGRMELSEAGSGDIHAASIAGDLNARVAGSGDVHVDGGQARLMSVSVAGSGDVAFGGVAQQLDARVMGSGDVRAAQVTGAVNKTIMGSGEVRTGD